MELIYLTSKKYPAKTADHFFVKEMAGAFAKILKERFSLVLASDTSVSFRDMHVINLGFTREHGRTAYYFFWLLSFAMRSRAKGSGVVFFSNDPNLLCILIILRKIFRFTYRVCSEWHMLFDDWRDAFIVRNSDFVVATSHRLMEAIGARTNMNIHGGKFLVVYGGVTVEKYVGNISHDARAALGLPNDKKLVAYIGLFETLGVKKSIGTMISALTYLPEDVAMVFVGGKKNEIEAYQEQISDKQLLARCIFIERQDSSKVPLYQQAVDILVIPNPDRHPFNDYCIPMKIYEYMASRKPIIYSGLALLDEVLHDCGFSFTPDDPKDLSQKIVSVLGDRSGMLSSKLDLCFEKAKQYSWEKRAEAIVSFLL